MSETDPIPEIKPDVKLMRPAWTYALLPGAIIVAAFLFSGTYLYANNGSRTAQIAQAPKTGTIDFQIDDIKKWAGTIKGMDKKAFSACVDSGKYADYVAQNQKSGESLGMVDQNAGTPAFFIDGVLLLGAQPISAFRAALEKSLTAQEKKTASLIALSPQDHVLGDPNAPHTIIEYSDFQCPYCRKFYEDTYAQLKKDYIDTGKALFVYRHFPLAELHPMAEKSAEATECANEQGKFWEMYNAIFTLQAK